ncbi:hypothetical protein EDD36DRAFT_466821 [Exophiala viscosa]|uniref:BZIP domain-containing protein n=1 Tax=Exophiala viscosa TaxID=2486360 RepID=A0AAN6DQI4_9EURO|nr:hypothetical protein EDD36DRAFT_466821 [Exophiala viscosa]
MAMSALWMDCMPPVHSTASPGAGNLRVLFEDRSMHVAEIAHSEPPAATPSVSPGAQLNQSKGSPMPSTDLVKASPSKTKQAPTKHGREFHFVDMRDKKEAQRIRNTINSRKHRQNKLDRIRELEKKLAASEAETQRLHANAEGPSKPGFGKIGTI